MKPAIMEHSLLSKPWIAILSLVSSLLGIVVSVLLRLAIWEAYNLQQSAIVR